MASQYRSFRRENPAMDPDPTLLHRASALASAPHSALTGRVAPLPHLSGMTRKASTGTGEPAPLDPTRLDVTADGAPIMWTVEETASFLGLTRHTLDVWRSNRSDGPVYVKIAGNRVRYFPTDVRDWLIARRRRS